MFVPASMAAIVVMLTIIPAIIPVIIIPPVPEILPVIIIPVPAVPLTILVKIEISTRPVDHYLISRI
jgi:hypothetical protein